MSFLGGTEFQSFIPHIIVLHLNPWQSEKRSVQAVNNIEKSYSFVIRIYKILRRGKLKLYGQRDFDQKQSIEKLSDSTKSDTH